MMDYFDDNDFNYTFLEVHYYSDFAPFVYMGIPANAGDAGACKQYYF